jgi:hypothetical protein
MDHGMVVREKITEKYLLNELDAGVRDEFEEHFFDCPECALDIQAGQVFVEHSKIILAEKAEPAPGVTVPAAMPSTPGWFGWLRPTVAVPLFALLLVVIGYQNIVVYPPLKEAVNHPQVLSWASINIPTRGATTPVIKAAPGASFLLFVNIPPESQYSHYIADFYNPAGKVDWSLTVPGNASADIWPVQVPAGNRESGTYILAVRGIRATGESQEIGRTSVELQIQK